MLIYYMMNSQTYKETTQNILSAESSNTANEVATDSVANILNTVVTNGTSNNITIDSVDANSRKVMNENLTVLYNGLILDTTKMEQVELKYIDNTSADKDKYVITYLNYENFAYVDSTLGKLGQTIYDNLLKVDNVGKIAISENYNAILKDIKVVNTLPVVISDNNKLTEYDTIKVIIADLDMNGNDEYIAILANKDTGYSKISLFDSNGKLVNDLAFIEKSKWNQQTNTEYYLSLDNVSVLDVDNDGAMEILIEIPKYEGEPSVSILKYKNNELTGKTNIECSLLQ